MRRFTISGKNIFAALAAMVILSVSLPAYAASESTVIGKVESYLDAVTNDMSRSAETALGDITADAARMSAETDIAIVHGGIFADNLPVGDVTYGKLYGLFTEDCQIFTAFVSPAELKRILESGVSRIVVGKNELIESEKSAYDGFPQVSGFVFQYDSTAPEGEKVLYINKDGKRLDLNSDEKLLSIAATEFVLNSAGIAAAETDISLPEALGRYIGGQGTISDRNETRIFIVGSNDQSLISLLPIPALLLAAAALVAIKTLFAQKANRQTGCNNNEISYLEN